MNSKTSEMLASAVRILSSGKPDIPVADVVLMIYSLGRLDTSMEQAAVDREIRQEGFTT